MSMSLFLDLSKFDRKHCLPTVTVRYLLNFTTTYFPYPICLLIFMSYTIFVFSLSNYCDPDNMLKMI